MCSILMQNGVKKVLRPLHRPTRRRGARVSGARPARAARPAPVAGGSPSSLLRPPNRGRSVTAVFEMAFYNVHGVVGNPYRASGIVGNP